MVETMLKELRKRFNILQCSMINSSITADEAKIKLKQILFAARILKVSLSKNEADYSQTEIHQVASFIKNLDDFKSEYADLFVDEEIDDTIVEDFKTHFPERIKRRRPNGMSVN